MTARDPAAKFLGASASAEPEALLGVRPGESSASRIEAALRDRIASVYAHPDGRSDEAERARQLVRRAAATLLSRARAAQQPPPSGASRRPPRSVRYTLASRLTEFDRQVLAILVACGGWNARTRARLVALAGAYGVSVQGLIKVVTGLSEYAKSGGPRLGVAEITAGRPRVALPAASSAAEAASQPEWAARLVPELKEESAESTVKLSLFFGLLTILVGVLVGRFVLFPPAAPQPAPPAETAPAPAAPRAAAPPPAEVEPAPPRGPATFPQRPTFQGRTLTPRASRAADECPRVPDELRSVARHVTVDEVPSEAVYRSWNAGVGAAAAGWVLLDDAQLEAITAAMFEALYAASDAPSVADRLLAPLLAPGRLLEPVDVWRGAWVAGVLARIGASTRLPPAVVQRARLQLSDALGGPPPGTPEFTAAATAWLDAAAARLAGATEVEPAAYDLWEFWIAAQRRLGRGDRFDAAVMGAVESVLATSTDLARPGPSVNVLGRLLELADFETSAVVKDRFEALLADGERIAARDLWVMTSLLAGSGTVPWFSEDLVLPPDADWMRRRRYRDRLQQRWPEEATRRRREAAVVRGIPVPPELAARWVAVYDRQQATAPGRTHGQRLAQLLAACRLNEAAVEFAFGDAAAAERMLEALEAAGEEPPPARAPQGRSPTPLPRGLGFQQQPGQSIGPDGAWAVAYEEAGRNAEQRVELIRSLPQRAGTDLGPIDAEVFVREVYRGTPMEVRRAAQDVIEQFRNGPNVVMELLDELPQAADITSTSETVRIVTGRLLPAVRAASWAADARLALVEHALELLGSPGLAVDAYMAAIGQTYEARRSRVDPAGAPPVGEAPPADAARRLAEAWRARALSASTPPAGSAPVPGPLSELRHRHATRTRLASGSIQEFVAGQLAVLDLAAYATAASQPGLREPLRAMLREAALQRREVTSALAQAVAVERTISALWRLQVAVEQPAGEAAP